MSGKHSSSFLALSLAAFGLHFASSAVADEACTAPLALCLLTEAEEVSADLRRAADRDEVLYAIVSAKVALGDFSTARAKADEIAGIKVGSEALGEIARGLAATGDFDGALEVALSIPDERQDSVRIKTLESVASELGAIGQVDAAFKAVEAIDNPYRRSEAQARIAAAVARAGDPERAIRVATRIATDYWFSPDQDQRKVASGVVSRAGEFDQSWFYESLADIARIQAVHADFKAAYQTAMAIPDAAGRSRALSHVGVLQAAAGDIDGAYRTAARIDAAYGDLEVLLAIVDAKAKVQDFAAATELAERIAQTYADYTGLMSVALRHAEAGAFDLAQATAARVDNPERRATALMGIAVSMVAAGQLDEAIAVSKLLTDPGVEVRALRAIAVELARGGEVATALQVAEDHASWGDQEDIVLAVALAQAQSGDLDGAIETARRIEDEMYRALALAGIAPLIS